MLLHKKVAQPTENNCIVAQKKLATPTVWGSHAGVIALMVRWFFTIMLMSDVIFAPNMIALDGPPLNRCRPRRASILDSSCAAGLAFPFAGRQGGRTSTRTTDHVKS